MAVMGSERCTAIKAYQEGGGGGGGNKQGSAVGTTTKKKGKGGASSFLSYPHIRTLQDWAASATSSTTSITLTPANKALPPGHIKQAAKAGSVLLHCTYVHCSLCYAVDCHRTRRFHYQLSEGPDWMSLLLTSSACC